MSKGRIIEGFKGKNIYLRVWDKVKEKKGIVQIIHGMGEHSGRYDEFAKFLNSKGYCVYADDHRGHGETGKKYDEYGYLGDDGFNSVVEDEAIISKQIKLENENLPLYIFAHSFGSFIGQEYITKYSNLINGIIFSGSCKQDKSDVKLGHKVSLIQKGFGNEKKKATLIDKVTFGSFNKKIKNPKNKFSWLTRDEAIVEEYIKDEHCGFVPTINFYYSLFEGFKNLYLPEKLNSISKNLKITLVSGDMDPVGHYGEGVKRLSNQYVDLKIKDVEMELFKEGRHEMINEINREEVYSYILKRLES